MPEYTFKVNEKALISRLTTNNTVDCEIHSRSKDVGTTTAKWFGELLSPSPWFKDVVPNVSNTFTYAFEAVHLTLNQLVSCSAQEQTWPWF